MNHQLIVEAIDTELERDIAHIPDCHFVVDSDGIGRWTCKLGTWVTWYGLEELQENDLFYTPGRHDIDFYSMIPESYFEDAEQYLYFVDAK